MATRRPRSASDEDDVPLHHKKPFGAGIKRKKVEFVRAQDSDDSTTATYVKSNTLSTSIGDLYASVVLGTRPSDPGTKKADVTDDEALATTAVDTPPTCLVCSLPITGPLDEHNASLAHQVSLAHSHPPSALDRSRMGLRALKAQGWDPDARQGLGKEGEGLRYPIKVDQKEDNLGIGAVAPQEKPVVEKPKPRSLSAKERRALAQAERKKADSLHREFHSSVDIEKYLRGDGTDQA